VGDRSEKFGRRGHLRAVVLHSAVLWTLVLAAGSAAGEYRAGETLSLKTAVAAALENDPWLKSNEHAQRSMEAMSVAAGELPDPTMSVGLANLPTDTFDFDQEPMTQFKVGITQMFPKGDTLSLKRKQLELLSEQFPYQRQDRKARLAVMAGNLWLEAYLNQESISLIKRDRPLFQQLGDVAEASYSVALGKTRQQDIIRAQLELTRLDDRLSALRQKKDTVLENLAELLSGNFRGEYRENDGTDPFMFSGREIELDKTLPDISMLEPDLYQQQQKLDPQVLYAFLQNHPAVLAFDQKIEATDTGVDLARQNYKPSWGVNASYGYREDAPNGAKRADFVSVGVTFDLPLFTKNRQDKQVESAVETAQSVKTDKWLLIRKMVADFESYRAKLKVLNERSDLYRRDLLPQMHDQAEASLNAYTNDEGDFAEVVRARIAELNAKLDSLNIEVERQKTLIQLNYYLMQSVDDIVVGSKQARG